MQARNVMNMVLVAGLAAGVAGGLAGCGEGGSADASGGAAGEAAGGAETAASAVADAVDEVGAVVESGAEAVGEGATAMADDVASGGLGVILEERKAAFRANADEGTQTLYAAGITEVAESGILDSAKNVGDAAPGFVLPDAVGRTVSLDDLLADGPIVMVWYRGGWCPYCNLTLRAYQERMAEIEAAGATLVAISPEVPDKSLDTQEKNELSFAVLSDINNAVAKRYGVVFELNEEVKASYANFFSLDEVYGNSTGDLPLSATYVINADGIITYAFLDADYTKRAEPDEVLAALRNIEG